MRQPQRWGGGSWDYPPLAEAMGEAGFEGIRKLITRRQNTVAQYIATHQLLDLCERATRRPGSRVSWRWWEQAGIDLEGANKRVAEAATESESEPESESESESEAELESDLEYESESESESESLS